MSRTEFSAFHALNQCRLAGLELTNYRLRTRYRLCQRHPFWFGFDPARHDEMR